MLRIPTRGLGQTTAPAATPPKPTTSAPIESLKGMAAFGLFAAIVWIFLEATKAPRHLEPPITDPLSKMDRILARG